MTADVAELRAVAVGAAEEAAELVRQRAGDEISVAGRKSSVVDVVTAVDRESEELLRRRLAERRPGDGFLGEESGAATGGTGVTWVVDPIDGTVNFLYGIPHYAVSVAAVDDAGETLAGAVVDVARGQTYSAGRGAGATCDGRRLRVRLEQSQEERLVLTGFGYDQGLRRLQGEAVARLVPQVRDVRRMGSAALELCTVAAGHADAYVEEGLHLWDRAAAGLIATEAGARVEVLPGRGGSDCIVCAPVQTFADVLDLVRSCGFLAIGSGEGGGRTQPGPDPAT